MRSKFQILSMNKPFLTILCAIFSALSLFAQPSQGGGAQREVTISGKVIDKETNDPLEYATIAFFNIRQNKIVTGGITDANGEFSIPVPMGMYNITIEYISFKTITISERRLTQNENIGTFTLDLDFEALGEVEIIAERTTVEIRLDKKIYNVGKDLTVSGGTVSDVLDNVPSVSVDVEGNVALRGNDNVRILINGKPSGLVGLNSTEALRQLPAESIEKVEVITSPSARYDAEGTAGILNIILRRSKLQGLNGAITARAGYPTSAGLSGNINYRTGDFNFFNTSGYSYRDSPGESFSSTDYLNGTSLREVSDSERIRKGYNTNFGVEWYITDSASFTNSIVYRESDNENTTSNTISQFDTFGELTDQSLRVDPELEDDKTIQYSSNFKKDFESGAELNIEFQYEDSKEREYSDILLNGLNIEKVDSPDKQIRRLLQADYVLPIGENSRFEAGFRGNYMDQATDYSLDTLDVDTNTFINHGGLTNLFKYSEDVSAIYSQYGSKFGKFSFLLGLRYEHTKIIIDQHTSDDFIKKDYGGLFPTVNLNLELTEEENITLGYSRRLRRPRSYFINPFPSRSSVTNIFAGNPDLDPTYSNTFDLGYLNRFGDGKYTLSTSIYYSHSTDQFSFVAFDTGETANVNGQEVPVIQRNPINLATNDRYGYELNLTYSPNRKWRLNGNLNLFKSITEGVFQGLDLGNENFSWSARLSNKYTLPGSIDWQTTMSYRGPSETGISKRKGMFSANLAFSKDLFKDKASIAFNISDLFNSRKFQSTTFTPTFEGYSERQWRQRSYNLSFTYRFNQKKKRERSRGDWQGGGEEMEFQGSKPGKP